MAGHAQLKFVMTECSKTQIRLAGLKWSETVRPERNTISLSMRPVWSFFAVRFMGNQGSMDGEDESFVFCVGVLRPSQQQGHVEPVS